MWYWGSMICTSWFIIAPFFSNSYLNCFKTYRLQCLFNIDFNTKLKTRTWQKDCFNEHRLLWNHLHVFEQVLLTDQPFTAFIFSSWLFITIGNTSSCQSHWNIKYYQNTSVVHSPSFYAPEIKDWGWWDIVLALSS